MTAPVISIVGKTNSGKTTFIEKLIGELKSRGLRVATIKHDVHGFEIDREGKDSWRHARAGAETVVIASRRKMAMVKRLEGELSLDEIAAWLLGEADVILTEGYKAQDKPKIEVVRKEVSAEPLCSPGELLALVSDIELDVSVPRFGLDDASGVADLLEKRYRLRPGRVREPKRRGGEQR